MPKPLLLLALSCLTLLAHAQTLAHIRQSQTLRCGIDRSEAEFSTTDEHGPRLAFDQAICKAVAVAILGPSAKVQAQTFPDDQTALTALRAGSVDLIPTISADLTHATLPGITLSRPILYDGQALMVPLSAHITTPAALSHKTVCFLDGTEGSDALRAWFRTHTTDMWPYPFQEQGEMEAAFVTGNCAALAGDLTRLAVTRLSFGPTATDYAFLPGLLSKDPLAAATLSSDPALTRIVAWTLEVLIQAEESGLTSTNAAQLASRKDPIVQRLLGFTRELGPPLGLDPAWAAHVVETAGNYGELFERTLGNRSPFLLPRGRNALSINGGLLEALPLK